jgi:HlyD family secretion protein
LSEVDITQIEVGQEANIVFDAISNQTFRGTVSSIASKASGVSSVYYEVTLSLDEIPAGLRWGMTAFVTFPLE